MTAQIVPARRGDGTNCTSISASDLYGFFRLGGARYNLCLRGGPRYNLYLVPRPRDNLYLRGGPKCSLLFLVCVECFIVRAHAPEISCVAQNASATMQMKSGGGHSSAMEARVFQTEPLNLNPQP